MHNRYSTPPAAVVLNRPGFPARRQPVSAMAKGSTSTLSPVFGVFVAHHLAKDKETMKAREDSSHKTGFSIRTFRTLSEKRVIINGCNG
jgi:hypothetical protein